MPSTAAGIISSVKMGLPMRSLGHLRRDGGNFDSRVCIHACFGAACRSPILWSGTIGNDVSFRRAIWQLGWRFNRLTFCPQSGGRKLNREDFYDREADRTSRVQFSFLLQIQSGQYFSHNVIQPTCASLTRQPGRGLFVDSKVWTSQACSRHSKIWSKNPQKA